MRTRQGRWTIDELASELERTRPDAVLVDCFGTLLRRRVPADRVKDLATWDLVVALGMPRPSPELRAMRRQHERDLARELAADDEPRDYRLPDLALRIYSGLDVETDLTADEFCDRFCAIELAVEIAVTAPNQPLASLLQALPAETHVVLVSDTTRTAPMLWELLAAHSIDSLVDDVIASCDAGATKRGGGVYERLALGGDRHQCAVMIGDNPLSDGHRAEAFGITSYLIEPGPWDSVKTAPRRPLRREFARSVAELVKPASDDDVFPELALTLWLFQRRLREDLEARGADQVVFLAREGLFLKELFDLDQQDSAHRSQRLIGSSYLLTSRASTFLAASSDPAERLTRWFTAHPTGTWADLAALVAAPPGEFGGSQPDATIDPDDRAALLGSTELLDAVHTRAEAQSAALRILLSRASPGTGPVQTVDVGWNGTVRDHLAPLVPDRPVHAHLLGLIARGTLTAPGSKTGHLFTNHPTHSAYYQVFSHFKELYELLLAAGHGSAASYRLVDGEVEVDVDDSEEELRCHRDLIAPVQRACRNRFAQLRSALSAEREEDSWIVDLVARHHARMMYRPTDRELDHVDALVQFENCGRRALKAVGEIGPRGVRPRGIRRHIGGGGWPPLRMRHAGAAWQRRPYGVLKTVQLHLGRLT